MRWLLFLLCIPVGNTCLAQNAAIRKGNEYYRNGNFSLAEARYRTAQSGTAQYNLANALVRQKKYREALQTLEDLVLNEKAVSVKAAAYYNAGVIYSRQKDLERSIEAYKASLRLDPADVQARENLQKALLEWKKQQADKQAQRKPSPLPKSSVEKDLQKLQEKERQLRRRLAEKRGGKSMENDW
jgi:Ca-activated chloride channel family protein